jgi:hypothetical protein
VSLDHLTCRYALTLARLTAIMLGRLKMTINEAMHQYYEIGRHVFQRPRLRGRGKLLSRVNDRFDGTYMDDVLKKATISPQMEATPITSSRRAEKNLRALIDYDAHGVRMRNPGLESART